MITCPDCGTSVLPDQPPFKSAADLAREVTRLRTALKQISDGAENQDIGHRDFRINARHCADAALREE